MTKTAPIASHVEVPIVVEAIPRSTLIATITAINTETPTKLVTGKPTLIHAELTTSKIYLPVASPVNITILESIAEIPSGKSAGKPTRALTMSRKNKSTSVCYCVSTYYVAKEFK